MVLLLFLWNRVSLVIHKRVIICLFENKIPHFVYLFPQFIYISTRYKSKGK